MASQRPHRPVIAYNYKVVRGEGIEADGAGVAPKAPAPTVAVEKAKLQSSKTTSMITMTTMILIY
jgi:hypothetical protein